jgi:hypothetical protein
VIILSETEALGAAGGDTPAVRVLAVCDCRVTYVLCTVVPSETVDQHVSVGYSARMARKTRFYAVRLTETARDLVQRTTFMRSLDLYSDAPASEHEGAAPSVARVTQSHVVIAALALAEEHAADHRRLIRALMSSSTEPEGEDE